MMIINLTRKHILCILLIIFLILAFLNIKKYRTTVTREEEVVPAWVNYDTGFLNGEYQKSLNKLDQLKALSNPVNLIYRITDIRINIPVTYLKHEIPLLRYYTPESLQSEQQYLYTHDEIGSPQIVKLKFDLRDADSQPEPDLKEEDKTEKESIQEPVPEPVKQNLLFLYHSHTSETYIDDPRSHYQGNVRPGEIGKVALVAQHLADILSRKYNYQVIHSTRVHDEVYRRSYFNSRETVKEVLQQYPGIDIIFDVHRDGVFHNARQAYTTVIDGKKTARIMIVVTNGSFDFAHLDLQERHHLEWRKNLEFARELADKMEKMYPGLLKDVLIRDTIYNQDLHPHSLLLEIGDYQNTTEEALRAAELFAEVIASLYGGRN